MAENPPLADHPRTDPGDGRTECERCGKYVWPAIHSCKGVRSSFAFALAARGLAEHPWQEFNEHGNTCHRPGCRLTEEEHAALAVLRDPNAGPILDRAVGIEQAFHECVEAGCGDRCPSKPGGCICNCHDGGRFGGPPRGCGLMATDPHPDCQHEWHGADGGKCPACGWDAALIPTPDKAKPGAARGGSGL